MSKFICTSKEKPAFDFKGNEIGITHKRALCYSKQIGKHRIYRSGFENLLPEFNVREFSSKEEAQKLCDEINTTYNDDFEVEEVIVFGHIKPGEPGYGMGHTGENGPEESDQPRCYIAGKIGDLPREEVDAKFENAEHIVRTLGYMPISPRKLPHLHRGEWIDYMREDVSALLSCDALYAINDWADSPGATVEVNLATGLKMELIYEQSPEDMGIEVLKVKAAKWDALDDEIGKIYGDSANTGMDDDESDGDLLQIGEIAAEAFGYL